MLENFLLAANMQFQRLGRHSFAVLTFTHLSKAAKAIRAQALYSNSTLELISGLIQVSIAEGLVRACLTLVKLFWVSS